MTDLQTILEEKRTKFKERWNNTPKDTATMNDFERIRTLGRGAFGRVLLVKHKESNVFYALKILSKSEIVKTRQVENAINEKRLLACVDFPFIIMLAYSFKDNSYLYMVLDFVIGGEMFTLLRTMRKFPEALARFYGAQVVLAFEYLHGLRVAYRDLKPENILINDDGYVKVADLGFAKKLHKDRRTWTLCGTPDYMAPEIITNKGHHCAVDWWAFGVLLYEMTAGFPPFMHQDQMKTFEHIISGKIRFTANFTADLKDLIRNLVQTDLSRRFGNLKSGVEDIKTHKWFAECDFLEIYNKGVKPPYKPKCKGPGDTSCFEKYEEENLKVAEKDKYMKEFEDF